MRRAPREMLRARPIRAAKRRRFPHCIPTYQPRPGSHPRRDHSACRPGATGRSRALNRDRSPDRAPCSGSPPGSASMSSASSPASHACPRWQGARRHVVASAKCALRHDQPDRDTLLIEGPADDGLCEWGRFRVRDEIQAIGVPSRASSDSPCATANSASNCPGTTARTTPFASMNRWVGTFQRS